MNSSSLYSLLFTLCLILISHSPLQANAESASKMFANVCKDATERTECMKVLTSNPQFSSAKHYRELSKLFLEFAINKTTEAQNFLKGLAETSKSAAIGECANADYTFVFNSFNSALLELEEDPFTACYDARVAGDGPNMCDSNLANEHIVNPAISALNKEIYLISTIAYLVTNFLS